MFVFILLLLHESAINGHAMLVTLGYSNVNRDYNQTGRYVEHILHVIRLALLWSDIYITVIWFKQFRTSCHLCEACIQGSRISIGLHTEVGLFRASRNIYCVSVIYVTFINKRSHAWLWNNVLNSFGFFSEKYVAWMHLVSGSNLGCDITNPDFADPFQVTLVMGSVLAGLTRPTWALGCFPQHQVIISMGFLFVEIRWI